MSTTINFTGTVTDSQTSESSSLTVPVTLLNRVMYDASVTAVNSIPQTADIVAGGDHWTAADYAKFPNAIHQKITAIPTNYTADIVDIETKCVWPPDAARQWVVGHQAAGLGLGCVYFWIGNLSLVQTALAGLSYYMWIADQTGVQHDVPGAVATQWRGYTGGVSVDISSVADPNWLIRYR